MEVSHKQKREGVNLKDKSISLLLGIIVTSFFLTGFSNEVKGANWELLGKEITGKQYNTYYFVDMSSIKKISSGKVRFWKKTFSADSLKESPFGPSIKEIQGKGYNQYIEIDCIKNRYRDVTTEKEAPKDYVIVETIKWLNIEPDSVEEKIAKTACQKK